METSVKKEKTIISVAFVSGVLTGIIWTCFLLFLSLAGGNYSAIPFSFLPLFAFSVPSMVSLMMPVSGGLLILTEALALVLAYSLNIVNPGIVSWIFIIFLILPIATSGFLFVYGGWLRFQLLREKEESYTEE